MGERMVLGRKDDDGRAERGGEEAAGRVELGKRGKMSVYSLLILS